jgi:hypothetical protein
MENGGVGVVAPVGGVSYLEVMPMPRNSYLPRSTTYLVCLLCALAWPGAASAQQQWTGIGAIGGTAMFMDTTTIVRSGPLRKVWVKSMDSSPKSFVAGRDTVAFDTVIGLNVFNCAKHTRSVESVHYLLGDDVVFEVTDTKDTGADVRPGSFFGAIYGDLCKDPH